MRKLLLSTLAGLVAAAGMAEVASAQTPPPGTTYTVVPFALGLNGTTSAGVPVNPAPGTIAVNIGGLFQYELAAEGSSAASYKGQKLANYNTTGFTRMWFGIDGQSTNGILYGSEWQVRQNFGAASGGATPGTGTGSSTFFVRTGYGYVKTTTLGMLRVGAAGGPATTYATGMFEAFNDGAWNGDVPNAVPSNTLPLYPYVDNGILYTTDKISYFTPNFSGFEFGVAWEPAFVTLNDATSCSTGAAGALSTCDDLASSNVAADAGKRRNTFDLGARYRGAFGPVGLALQAGYIGSGVVNYTGVGQRYRGLDLGHVGAEITVAGLMVGGHVMYGAQNGQWYLEPVGGKLSTSYMAGVQYTRGPVVVGTSFFENWGTGDYTKPAVEGQRREYGLAAGGYYALTQGLGFYLAYLYGDRKQSGYDFLAGATGTTNNDVHSQIAGVGISLQW
jgi:hypothetical protein